MIVRGVVSSTDNSARKARVILPEHDGKVTPEFPVATSVGYVNINDTVVIAFFSDDPADGLIIARV